MPPIDIHVHLLPRICSPIDFSGQVAVVIDILRATTTIATALANGAKAVHAVQEVSEALMVAEQFIEGEYLLGGERHGEKIDGFHLDNSPLAYTPEVVNGKEIIFTTTNGTRAMAHCRMAKEIHLGSFNNLSALVNRLQEEAPKEVHLLCAGTDSLITHEDVLFAGAICEKLGAPSDQVEPGNDTAKLALDTWKTHSQSPELFYKSLCNSRGGANLVKLGFDADIRRAAELDLYEIVPNYDPKSGKITA
ncbi:putative 2-phosphosulfolactate phosphatase [Polystyrenella longa]|uniref:Probable 2-phosphosulfolactate phosphatase n=1 Tax=Polystyrenella longa TaxID=2528007 RepID=A0A518CN77_9PLAN|nr:2-phosphosulfolactate phosphatase [Polystyrenella longa]QDU80677.1 putative 2-phosphosulfolactate phosphatase [Polystyrenella longa]